MLGSAHSTHLSQLIFAKSANACIEKNEASLAVNLFAHLPLEGAILWEKNKFKQADGWLEPWGGGDDESSRIKRYAGDFS